MRVLIVEDNSAFGRLVADRLGQLVIDSDQASSVEEAERAISTVEYAAIILDLGLPVQDGSRVVRHLWLQGDATSVLVMTARDGLEDRVKGLREGAADYLAQPFSMDELVARLQALLRRPGKLLGQLASARNLTLYTENRQVNIGDRVHP